MDSAYYAAKVIAAIRPAGALFPVTVPMDPKVKAAIAAIPEDDWTAIKYPRAIWDDQLRAGISDAQVGRSPVHGVRVPEETGGHRPAARPPGPRLEQAGNRGPGRTVPPLALPRGLRADPGRRADRGHAIVEQVFADVTDGPLAHMPSGSFAANAAWLACAAIAHNLLRDEASFLGELVDDVEFGEDALCGVDHGGDRGYVAFELQETIAVRRAVTVEAQKPRWVVAPLIPAERGRRTMARAEPRRGRDGPAGSLRVDHRAARSGHPQADGDGGPLQLSLYSRPGGHVATADGGRRSATRWTATLARSGSA
jgi:hypothetical protein